jgi:hypothetical protein
LGGGGQLPLLFKKQKMSGLKEYSAKIQNLLIELTDIEDSIIDDNADSYAKENVNYLYEQGKTSEGISLPEYSEFTKEIKRKKGQPIDRMTLRDTKAFHNSFFAEYKYGKLEITANDEKTTELTKRYGSDIFGLTEEKRRQVSREIILPIFVNEIKNLLTKKTLNYGLLR